jgi:hypothetical protein
MEVIIINLGFFMEGDQGFPGSQRGFSGFGGQGQNSQGFQGGQRQTYNFSANRGRNSGGTGNINPDAFKEFFMKSQKQK